MATSVTSTGITFPDATTQTTAASASSYVGDRSQFFTSSGTFTVPTGVTAIKVTVIGGGGGGGQYTSPTTGSAGGTTSFGAYVSATGGGGAAGPTGGTAGSGSSGTINWSGSAGGNGFAAPTDQEGAGGGSMSGIVITDINGSNFAPGQGYFGGTGAKGGYNGGGGTPTSTGYGCGGGCNHAGGGGGAGGAIRWITGLTPGATITVTIGAGGTGFTNNVKYNGIGGACLVEW